MSPTFRALSVRNYRIYASGSLISNIGTWMQNTAQAWLVLVLTGSGTAIGITVALQLLPTLLLSPYGGVLADRFDKRTVLRVMQIAMAVPSALLGVLAVTGLVQVWHVYVIALVFGVGRALEAPSRQAFVPEMVDAEVLGNAVALNSASFNAGRLVGPGLAGVMIAGFGGGVAGTGWVITINAFSYLAALWALQVMDIDRLTPTPVIGRGKGAVREGVRYVRSRPDLVLVLTCVFFLGGFGMNFQITSALMATQEFGRGASEYGLLGSLLAIGSLTGALLAARRTTPRIRFVVLAGLAFSVVQVVSGLMPTYVTYAIVLPLIGVSVLTMATTANAYIQMTVTPAMRGRVAALYLTVFIGSVPFVAPLVGWVGEHLGARAAVVGTGLVAGLGVLVTTIWYLARRRTGTRREEWRALTADLRSNHGRQAEVQRGRRRRAGLRLPQRRRAPRTVGPRGDRDPADVR
ncbi:MFS transporter [Aeromicrobium sp. CTD01-1L150]|uniref:MFS transporter n=1 Tax=Aeromicrobium sp. CTD01-1L150 TaxID=3341830 RepID=UPI0035C0B40C